LEQNQITMDQFGRAPASLPESMFSQRRQDQYRKTPMSPGGIVAIRKIANL